MFQWVSWELRRLLQWIEEVKDFKAIKEFAMYFRRLSEQFRGFRTASVGFQGVLRGFRGFSNFIGGSTHVLEVSREV